MRTFAGLVALVVLAVACSTEPAPTPPTATLPTATSTSTASTATSALTPGTLALTEVAQLDAPTALAVRPGSPDLYIAERAGTVRRISNGAVSDPLVDVSTTTDGERGLLGLAFDPTGHQLYLSYTDQQGNTRIDRFTIDGETVESDSREPIFSTDQPFANHNGGHIAFGPDGRLYLGLGDGGGAGDPLQTAQDPDSFLGSIIRFADDPTAEPEIWIIGVRNPWRFSWDRATGDLWVADVGQNAVEEVTVLFADAQPWAGANLGWPQFEGHQPFAEGPEPDHYVPPLYTYTHDPGCSITGGYVYQGADRPELQGGYLYSDYCDPTLRVVFQEQGLVTEARSLEVAVPGGSVVSFGEGAEGELYVLSLAGGVYRIT